MWGAISREGTAVYYVNAAFSPQTRQCSWTKSAQMALKLVLFYYTSHQTHV